MPLLIPEDFRKYEMTKQQKEVDKRKCTDDDNNNNNNIVHMFDLFYLFELLNENVAPRVSSPLQPGLPHHFHTFLSLSLSRFINSTNK